MSETTHEVEIPFSKIYRDILRSLTPRGESVEDFAQRQILARLGIEEPDKTFTGVSKTPHLRAVK